ncbi:MAG: MlaD family protein [Candidatus Omnitrophota bacterium]|nr:MlaD family protein [Candidatus Omnitrophota bacterium]
MAVEQNLELKVGIFVLIALIVLSGFVFLISDISLFKPGWNLKIIFGFANGLKKSAPLRLAGVDMGKVQDIRIFYDSNLQKTRIEILAWLNADAKVPVDSKAWINQLGLLGEKYVEIIPGKNYSSFLKTGDQLVGVDPIAMEELAEMGRKIALKLEDSLEGFNEVVKDEVNRKSLKEMIENLKNLSDSANTVLSRVKDGQGTVGKLLYDEKIYNDLESFAEDIKKHPWKLLFKTKEKKVKDK